MTFIVNIHDAVSSSDDCAVYDSAESAAKHLGINWEVKSNPPSYDPWTHSAEIPNEEGGEPFYACGKYVEFGERVSIVD